MNGQILEKSEFPIQNVLLVDMKETFEKCLEIAIRKNNDYGGTNKDPYANFRNSTMVGVSVEKGMLVRMMDKMSRISTLLDKQAKVTDESIEDTLEDLANYAIIMKSYIKRSKNPEGL
jgi:hypothetical protein